MLPPKLNAAAVRTGSIVCVHPSFPMGLHSWAAMHFPSHSAAKPLLTVPCSRSDMQAQALHTHGRRLRVSMEGDAVSPRSPAAALSPRADNAFHTLQRTSWEQQRNRSFDSARGRTQVLAITTRDPTRNLRLRRDNVGKIRDTQMIIGQYANALGWNEAQKVLPTSTCTLTV